MILLQVTKNNFEEIIMDILILVGVILANIVVLAVEGFPIIRILITILITTALFFGIVFAGGCWHEAILFHKKGCFNRKLYLLAIITTVLTGIAIRLVCFIKGVG